MNSFKLLVVFILLLLGSFAQRFQRHSINDIKNGNGNTKMENLDALSSDGENAVQNGNSLKFVGNEREGVELGLENKELMFKFCSDGCMDKVVIACFESADSNHILQGVCAPGQCMFKAGVSKDKRYGTNLLWFMSASSSRSFHSNEIICENAAMMSPEAKAYFTAKFPSCDPLKHDGNVVKLYVHHVEPGCPLYVLNAKKWIPPTTTTTTQNSSALSEIDQTTSKSSEANTTLWIGIGVGIFIILIVVIGFGYCCYRTQIQKKPLFGTKKHVQQKAFVPDASKKANVVKEKAENEKEVVAKPEPTKESTKEETTVTKEKQPKPTKKKASKEKKAIVEAKPSKEKTEENVTKEDAPEAKKFSTESTLQDPSTEASVVQQKQLRNPPRVYVPKKIILPAMNSDGFKSVPLLDTLSGAENDETQGSTHASEKPRKNESAGTKKGSKKLR